MASVLAIVSKALFEKMVPGKEELGIVVDTDQYVSANKAFDQLGAGDAIFLVTVRPPKEDLWLVGVLEAPTKNGKAWKSASNTAPVTNISSVLKKLELASGEGIKAKKGTLGMSLQTPRVLTDKDDKAIRALIKAPSTTAKKVKATQDYADAVAAGPKKKKSGGDDDDFDDENIVDEAAAKPSKSAKKPAGPVQLGTLRLDNYRKPFFGSIDQLGDVQRGQLQALIDSDMDSEGMKVAEFFGDEVDDENHPLKGLEWIDVVEIATKQIVGELLIFPFGDGVVLKPGTEKMIANIVQHSITPTKDTTKAWMTDFAKAWWEGAPRLKVVDPGHFGFSSDQIADEDDEDDDSPKPLKSPEKKASTPAGKPPKAKATKGSAKKAAAKKPAAKTPAKKAAKKPAKKRR